MTSILHTCRKTGALPIHTLQRLHRAYMFLQIQFSDLSTLARFWLCAGQTIRGAKASHGHGMQCPPFLEDHIMFSTLCLLPNYSSICVSSLLEVLLNPSIYFLFHIRDQNQALAKSQHNRWIPLLCPLHIAIQTMQKLGGTAFTRHLSSAAWTPFPYPEDLLCLSNPALPSNSNQSFILFY